MMRSSPRAWRNCMGLPGAGCGAEWDPSRTTGGRHEWNAVMSLSERAAPERLTGSKLSRSSLNVTGLCRPVKVPPTVTLARAGLARARAQRRVIPTHMGVHPARFGPHPHGARELSRAAVHGAQHSSCSTLARHRGCEVPPATGGARASQPSPEAHAITHARATGDRCSGVARTYTAHPTDRE